MPLEHPERLAGHGDQMVVEMVRQLRDVLHEFRDDQKLIKSEVHDISVRTALLEAREERMGRLEAAVQGVTAKYDDLAVARQQQLGALKFFEWISKHWQMIALLVAGAVYVMRDKI